MINLAHYDSPVGGIHLAERDGGLVGLWIDGQTHFKDSIREETAERETPALTEAKLWLDRYFAGEQPSAGELRLCPEGGEFRRTVWDILCEIPYGQVVTYGQVAREAARRMGRERMSAQAVGGAVGHNQISVIIPCHRVVGAGGDLTGYAGGIDIKVKLLAHEGVDMAGFHFPKSSAAPQNGEAHITKAGKP